MEKLPMCRICLVQNVRMFVVVNRNLRELYEKLTDIPFVTEDRRPMLACFFCCSKLKQCCRLLRQCLKAEELFAQKMNEDYELKPLINQDHLEFYSGFIKSPIVHISIVGEGQTESIAIKEETPAVCEGLDDVIESKEEYQSEELELENSDNSCLDVADIPPQHSESDSEDDVPLNEFQTEVEEEQEVCKKKRKARDTKSMSSRKRVSVRQIELLVEYLEGHRDLARGRLRSREGSALTSRLWTECANILNAEADGDQRTPKEWTKWYTDYKCRLLNRVKQIRQNQRGTGGGPGVPTSLSPLDERIAALLDAGTEAVGRSGTPQNEVQINPLSPAPHAVSPLPALANSQLPALPDYLTLALPTSFTLPSDNTEHAPTANNSTNINEDIIIIDPLIYPETTQDITHLAESDQEATATRQRRSNNPCRRRRQSPPPSSELDQAQNRLANLEKSRIEVERLVAEGYNKMADAMNKVTEAAIKSADAQCRIAEALANINSSLARRRRRRSSSDEE